MSVPLQVVLLAEDGTQAEALQKLMQPHLELKRARTLRELEQLLATSQFDLLFCDWRSRSMGWGDVLEKVHQHDLCLPVIGFSRNGGEKEWIEAIGAGAFDLLAPPYEERLLLSVAEHAAASRQPENRAGSKQFCGTPVSIHGECSNE